MPTARTVSSSSAPRRVRGVSVSTVVVTRPPRRRVRRERGGRWGRERHGWARRRRSRGRQPGSSGWRRRRRWSARGRSASGSGSCRTACPSRRALAPCCLAAQGGHLDLGVGEVAGGDRVADRGLHVGRQVGERARRTRTPRGRAGSGRGPARPLGRSRRVRRRLRRRTGSATRPTRHTPRRRGSRRRRGRRACAAGSSSGATGCGSSASSRASSSGSARPVASRDRAAAFSAGLVGMARVRLPHRACRRRRRPAARWSAGRHRRRRRRRRR